jgi:hypothetical protein
MSNGLLRSVAKPLCCTLCSERGVSIGIGNLVSSIALRLESHLHLLDSIIDSLV